MNKRSCGWTAIRRAMAVALLAVAAVAAGPGVALAAGMGGSMGGGGSRGGSSGGGSMGGTWSGGGGGWRGGGSWNGGSSWHGGSGWRGGWWGGPRFFVGVGAPFWWYPYGYAYAYPYPVYSPPVVVDSAPQTYIQQDVPSSSPAQSYWYYCEASKTYYPYVKDCPAGWLQVVPQTAPPTR